MSNGEPDIRALYDRWINAATANGGIQIGAASEGFRLHNNRIQFHDLSYDQLREAAVGLTKVLLLPGLNTIIDLDHSLFWSWCAELLLGHGSPFHVQTDGEIGRLASTAVRCALANVRPPTMQAFEQSRAASGLLEHNAQELLNHAHDVLPYLAFPLLEAVARRACKNYVDLSGKVVQRFNRRKGSPYTAGSRCSNVGDLLCLLVATAADDLSSDVVEVLEHVSMLRLPVDKTSQTDGYEVVFDWRNSSLHGEASLTTIGGTVLSLALLIALHGIRDDYEIHQAAAIARAQREISTARFTDGWRPSPWSYYPPFLPSG